LGGVRRRGVLIDGNADLIERGELVLAFLRLRRGLDGRQHTLFLVGEQVPALLTDANDAPDLFTRFLIIQRQAVIPLANELKTAVSASESSL
jgi:hypothetical protein